MSLRLVDLVVYILTLVCWQEGSLIIHRIALRNGTAGNFPKGTKIKEVDTSGDFERMGDVNSLQVLALITHQEQWEDSLKKFHQSTCGRRNND